MSPITNNIAESIHATEDRKNLDHRALCSGKSEV